MTREASRKRPKTPPRTHPRRLLAALFAAGSLWLGLTVNHFDFVPLFWAMHTAFIPTLMILSAMLLMAISDRYRQPTESWLQCRLIYS